MIGRLCLRSCNNLSHRLPQPCLLRIHSAPYRSLSSSQYSDLLNPPGQFAGGEPCGDPVASLQYTVSLVQWVNHLLPAWGAGGVHPHLQWNQVLQLAMFCYSFIACFNIFFFNTQWRDEGIKH
jgi:hypothetical protein